MFKLYFNHITNFIKKFISTLDEEEEEDEEQDEDEDEDEEYEVEDPLIALRRTTTLIDNMASLVRLDNNRLASKIKTLEDNNNEIEKRFKKIDEIKDKADNLVVRYKTAKKEQDTSEQVDLKRETLTLKQVLGITIGLILPSKKVEKKTYEEESVKVQELDRELAKLPQIGRTSVQVKVNVDRLIKTYQEEVVKVAAQNKVLLSEAEQLYNTNMELYKLSSSSYQEALDLLNEVNYKPPFIPTSSEDSFDAFNNFAQRIVQLAKSSAPVLTGALKDSIDYSIVDDRHIVIETIDYGVYLEYGHHTSNGSFVRAQPYLKKSIERAWEEYKHIFRQDDYYRGSYIYVSAWDNYLGSTFLV